MKKYWPYIVLIITLLFIKLISIKYTPLDSDEVMWSVMAKNIIEGKSHYLFFTDQNFRGSLEAYIISPFQYLFGINEFTLRINNIIFGLINTTLIFYIIYDLSKNKKYSLYAALIYFFSQPEIYFLQNKAWGGYITAQSLMLISFIVFNQIIINFNYEKFNFWSITLGLICGISFFINEQSIYFLFLILFFAFIIDLLSCYIKLNKFNKVFLAIFYLNNFVILYFLIKKRMYLNLNISLIEKLNFNTSLLNFNIYLKDLIIYSFIIFIIFNLLHFKYKKLNFVNSSFLNISFFSLVVMLINIFHNSFSRISSPNNLGFVKAFNFFQSIIVNQMFGFMFWVFLFAGVYLAIFRIKEIIITKKINFIKEDIYLAAFFIYPLFFLFSALPGLAPSPRYLLIWWPISIVILFLFLKNFYIYFMHVFVIVWFVSLFLNYSKFYEQYNFKINQDISYQKKVSEIKSSKLKYCVGSYWNIGAIMFYSNLEIKCFTDRKFGLYYKFLDIYKQNDISQVYIIN